MPEKGLIPKARERKVEHGVSPTLLKTVIVFKWADWSPSNVLYSHGFSLEDTPWIMGWFAGDS